MPIILELTDTEAEVVADYLLNKIMRLEDCGLEDSKCYKALDSTYCKLSIQINKNKKEDSK